MEFFSEDLWLRLPSRWQQVLGELSYSQIADLLLDSAQEERRYPSVWPLSLLAFRATAHSLAFPRQSRPEGDGSREAAAHVTPEEFLHNQSQSCLLGHIFRKHVKPKKQHEIRMLGALVKGVCEQTDCSRVVDVGSGQGHLTRFLSFGLGLSVTGIEADHALVAMASRFDGQLLWTLEKEKQRQNVSSVSLSSPRHVAGWVNPKASWKAFIQQLSTVACPDANPLVPSGPCKKRLRGSEHQAPGPLASPDPDSPSQDSGTAPLPTNRHGEGANPVEAEQPDHPDFVLTGLHACGDLSATLLRHFVSCPHVRGITSVACCYMKITTEEHPAPPGLVEPPVAPPPGLPSAFGYPMSSWVKGLPGHGLSYKAREGACHAVEDYMRRLREGSELLRTHCYRAMLETFVRDLRPDLRRAGIQTIKKAHMLAFTEYARLGLARVGLPAESPLDRTRVEAMLKHQVRVVVYFSLSLLLAPVVESLVLLDRMIYLQENGVDSRLVPLFNPNLSPRNFVLVALKPGVENNGDHQSS
ncbi:methyltransferase-like protein 25B isoform X2 [Genypterus blacodes]|uniref:methyltransferase-like protein 25B isoform X2 n=1 Tax=Genypterus blacodes TaxID=154954 RepID=UPI003F7688DB